MFAPSARLFGASILVSVLALGSAPVAHGVEGPGPLIGTGLSAAIAVSGDGHYILGVAGKSKVSVWDTWKSRSARKLPSGTRYRYFGISTAGTLISYSQLTKFNGCSAEVPKVRYRKSNKTRVVATAANGRTLTAGWRPARCPGDEDDSRLSYAPGFSSPALSGNGRYVAFCANLDAPNSRTLYRKDLKTGALTIWQDACFIWSEGGDTGFAAPQISDDGQVILLPSGPSWSDEAITDATFGLIVAGVAQSPIAGRGLRLDGAGDVVLAQRPGSGCGFAACPPEAVRYEVATGVSATLAANSPIEGSITSDASSAMFDAFTHPLAVANLRTGRVSDLAPAVQGLGVTPATVGPATSPWYSGSPLITPDGMRVIFRATTGKVYSYRWAG